MTSGRIVGIRDFGKILFFDLESECSKEEYVTDNKDYLVILKNLKLGSLVSVDSVNFNQRGKKIVDSLIVDLIPTGNFLKHDLINDKEINYKNRALALATNISQRQKLIKRSQIIKTIRKVLENYHQVETPVLQENYGGAFARPFLTKSNYNNKDYYLRICHEFYLKKALIGGLDRVYHIGPVFRNEDLDSTHTYEFTMLEAYERNGTYETMIELIETIVCQCANTIGITKIGPQDLSEPWPRFRFKDLVNLLKIETLNPKEQMDLVESHLKKNYGQSCFHLIEIPALIMPLAKNEGPYALYADSYARGVELGTMYSEENDPVNLKNKWDKTVKEGLAETPLINNDFMKDLSIGAPTAGGIGIGVDRLCKVLLNVPSIRDAQAFPLI